MAIYSSIKKAMGYYLQGLGTFTNTPSSAAKYKRVINLFRSASHIAAQAGDKVLSKRIADNIPYIKAISRGERPRNLPSDLSEVYHVGGITKTVPFEQRGSNVEMSNVVGMYRNGKFGLFPVSGKQYAASQKMWKLRWKGIRALRAGDYKGAIDALELARGYGRLAKIKEHYMFFPNLQVAYHRYNKSQRSIKNISPSLSSRAQEIVSSVPLSRTPAQKGVTDLQKQLETRKLPDELSKRLLEARKLRRRLF